jgi:hypothetical protein
MLAAPPLLPLPTEVAPDALGLRISTLRLSGWSDASVRVLRPFSWDAKHRAFDVVDLIIDDEHERCLVMGPYAAADAAAWNVDPALDVGFPNSSEHDGVLYRTAGSEAGAADRFQDAAGWFTLVGTDTHGQHRVLAAAVDRSETLIVRLRAEGSDLQIDLVLPRAIADPTAAARRRSLPRLMTAAAEGRHEAGESLLREALASVIPASSRYEHPPLIADTWGFGTEISPGLVTAFTRSAADLTAEIVTLDKGWEAAVGDWRAADGYVNGVPGIAEQAHAHGLALGLWMAVGNADPRAEIVNAYPDWLATWRGGTQWVSHRTHSLCLGHRPVQEHLISTLDRLANEGLRWFLHDFETISRCDANHHDHDPGLGESAAADGWYRVLAEVRARHPELRIENCWNGGRPLDLAMIAHHDTTIGDDWCDVKHNTAAKIGLGRYLPASWCSAYMSDEPELSDRAQFALYAVGGPWVIMGDPTTWSLERREVARATIDVYRSWRNIFARTRVEAARLTIAGSDGARSPAGEGIHGVELRDGDQRALVAVVVHEPMPHHELRWHPPVIDGTTVIRDAYTGQERRLTDRERDEGIVLACDAQTGHLMSVERSG